MPKITSDKKRPENYLPAETKHNHIGHPLFWLLTILLVFAAGVTSAYVYFQFKSVNAPLRQNTEEKLSESATAESDWSTYTNTDYSFSFKYPTSWGTPKEEIIDQGGVPKTYLKVNIGDFVLEVSSPIFSYNCGDIIYQISENENEFDISYEKINTFTSEDTDCYQRFAPKHLIYAIEHSAGKDGQNFYAYLLADSLEDGMQTMKKIISSFEILDPTAEWETYTNARLGFSIKYPPGWTPRVGNATGANDPNGDIVSLGRHDEIQITTNLNTDFFDSLYDLPTIESDIIVGGASARKKVIQSPDGELIHILLSHNDTEYTIGTTTLLDAPNIFDEILSTFKFTDVSTTNLNPTDYGINCAIDQQCGDLTAIDCGQAYDGPYYYVDNTTGDIVETCGGACMDRSDTNPYCKQCPPLEWTCN